MGMDFVACAPKKYFPNAELVAQCEEYAKESGATITLTEDVKRERKTPMLSIRMSGYPWVSRTAYGRRESTI